jgi:hypothetical protein
VKDGQITSELRILAALPTLRLALEKGAAVMVTSHLGRPKEGVWTVEDSLAPVAARLSHLLDRPVPLVRDWVQGVAVQPGEIVLLENCRMNVGEGADDEALARKYAALCDVFVMDAFGTPPRLASTHGRYRPGACGGPARPNRCAGQGARASGPAIDCHRCRVEGLTVELVGALGGKSTADRRRRHRQHFIAAMVFRSGNPRANTT